MRPADRRQTIPLALPLNCYARGSSCPQCGRRLRWLERIVFGTGVVLHRRPQCGQQLVPSPQLGFVRACSDDLKSNLRDQKSGLDTPVLNRPPKRDSFRGELEEQAKESASVCPFELAACWAHARRKFVAAEPNYPEVGVLLDLIGDLYEVETRTRAATAPLVALRELRREQSKSIIEDIEQWLRTTKALPRSSLGEAIAYTLKLWPALTRFLENPKIPLDNNATERALRGIAVGRKNHYGSRSLRGTEVAALFYSLIESAKLAGLEPQAYLREATKRAIRNPGTVTLPHVLLAGTSSG